MKKQIATSNTDLIENINKIFEGIKYLNADESKKDYILETLKIINVKLILESFFKRKK